MLVWMDAGALYNVFVEWLLRSVKYECTSVIT